MNDEGGARLKELRDSARGWHGVQLAVLGFIGLCGVLQGSAGSSNPWWLQVLAGFLTLGALVLACLATALIASAAWPIYGSGTARDQAGDEQELRRTSHRLRLGIAITFLAVGVQAVAASSAWWPSRADASPVVEVTTGNAVLCGQLGSAGPGALQVDIDGAPTLIALADVQQLRPRESCE